jgi:hypothetical protein
MRTALDISVMCEDFNRSNALKRLPDDAPHSGVKTVAVVEMKIPVVMGAAADGAERPKVTLPPRVVLAPDMIGDAEVFLLATEGNVFGTWWHLIPLSVSKVLLCENKDERIGQRRCPLTNVFTAYNAIDEQWNKEGWQQRRIVDSTMLTLTVYLNHVSRRRRNKSSRPEHSRGTITPLGRMALKAQSSTVRMPRRLPQLGRHPRMLAPWFSSMQMQPLTR